MAEMKPHTLTTHDHCTGRAMPKIARRSSGWWDWFCLTSLGERVGDSGFEKSRRKAVILARESAQSFNQSMRRERPKMAIESPYCVPAGEGTEIFKR